LRPGANSALQERTVALLNAVATNFERPCHLGDLHTIDRSARFPGNQETISSLEGGILEAFPSWDRKALVTIVLTGGSAQRLLVVSPTYARSLVIDARTGIVAIFIIASLKGVRLG
jgi:hypothetical protein